MFSIVIVVYQNLITNKLNSNNFLVYLKRIGFLVFADIFFDWIKIILIYKYSGFEVNSLKVSSFEIAAFHEKLHNNAFTVFKLTDSVENNLKSSASLKNDLKTTYLLNLEKIEFEMVAKDKNQYWKYNNILDYDVIMCMELENNVIIYCVFVSKALY